MRGIALVLLLVSSVAHAEHKSPLEGQPCCKVWSQRGQLELAASGWARFGDGVPRAHGGALHAGYDVGRLWGIDVDARSDRAVLAGGHAVLAIGHAYGLGYLRLAVVASAEVGWSTDGAIGAISLGARVFLAHGISLDLGARELDRAHGGRAPVAELGLGWWLP
jgi:hypothetical protein